MSFTFVDISDMFFYLGHHRNVSGIQRVQSNLVRSVCLAERDLDDIHFVSLNQDRSRYQLLNKGALVELMHAISSMEIGHESIKNSIRDITVGAAEPQFRSDDVVIVTGAFWIYSNVYSLFNRLKMIGVLLGCYVYDLIPINQPDFCTKDLTLAFKGAFNHASHFFDFMMTISDHTRGEVDAYLRSAGLPETVTATVRLAHTINDHSPSTSGFDLGGMVFNDFVLCVGTIEARKNHQLLYQVWKLLLEARITPMPKLVIVGRWGWRVDDLKAQLAATDYLDGSIVVLSDVDDETLELLYRECRFTIFPSFVEGWGMPVGESLVHGRFCLASRSSSIPEVGGRFVDYIDPFNAREAFETVRKFLVHPALLEAKHEFIRSQFVARTWGEFRADFIATASRCAKQAGARRKPPIYPIIHYREEVDASNKIATKVSAEASKILIASELAFAEGWDLPETLGRWMNGRRSRISFRLDRSIESGVIKLNLYSVSWALGNSISITYRKHRKTYNVHPGGGFTVSIEISERYSNEENIEILLELEGPYDHIHDPRDLCVGIASIQVV